MTEIAPTQITPDPAATLLVIVAHPDDESFGCGSVIADAADRGWRVIVCSASRGEAGEDASGRGLSGHALGVVREDELRAASSILGSTEVVVLDFVDSGWDGDPDPASIVARPAELTAAVAELLGRHRPDVVVTMDPTGSDGHRDHAAVGSAVTAAVHDTATWPISLYHWCLPHSLMDEWARAIARSDPSSVYLGTELGRADADITTIVDAGDALDRRRRSIAEHRTQTGPYRAIPAELADRFLIRDHLVRVIPPWAGGPTETALQLPGAMSGAPVVHPPATPDYLAACASFNVAAPPTPDSAVVARSVSDIQQAVRYAAEHQMTVAPHVTGHGSARPVGDGLLINIAALDSVHIDPDARTATVGGGVRWRQVIDAAAPFGLAPLNGSSSHVGVVGYLLGGGMGPMARTFGFAADRVRGLRMVDPLGDIRTVNADSEPDLFWALRGGKHPVGVITEVTFDLVPVRDVYGGALFLPGDCAPAALHTFREWAPTLPASTTASIALVRLPDIPSVPEPLRGRLSVHLRYVHVGSDDEGGRLLAPMRSLAIPLLDGIGRLPYPAIDAVHCDPTEPMPAWDSGCLLGELPAAAVDAMLEVAGPDVDVPLVIAEFRMLGGRLRDRPKVANAVSGRQAAFLACTIGAYPPPLRDAVDAAGGALMTALRPWSTGTQANFPDRVVAPGDPHRVWAPEVVDRLRTVAAAADPESMFATPW